MNTVKHLLPILLLAVAFTHAANVKAELGSGAGKEVSPKEGDQIIFCMKFEQAEDTVDVETLFEHMEKSPYAKDMIEFWTAPACRAPLNDNTKIPQDLVPIVFNSATNAPKSENFPKAVHDYFVEDKKQPEVWLKIVNSRSTKGSTFLDFLHYNLARDYYSVKRSKDAALRIVDYLCQHGGVYSKYRDTARCP